MSSESHKPNHANSPLKTPPRVDPAKLTMVSDYLKRTVSARPYAFILESLVERLEMDRVDRRLTSVGIIPVPPDLDVRTLADGKSVAFLPYCSTPFDCPSNAEYGRKCNKCQAVEGLCDHLSCSVGRFIQVVKKFGVKQFHIIDTDSGLFEWLAKKREEGYTHVFGVACEFAVSYALEVIHGQLGFDGLIVTINGDKCKTKEEYAESDASDRDRITFVDEWTISTIEEIADQIMAEGAKKASKGDAD